MVTMTTVSMVICHTHLIAMLYYCGYLLQAGEIGRGYWTKLNNCITHT